MEQPTQKPTQTIQQQMEQLQLKLVSYQVQEAEAKAKTAISILEITQEKANGQIAYHKGLTKYAETLASTVVTNSLTGKGVNPFL